MIKTKKRSYPMKKGKQLYALYCKEVISTNSLGSKEYEDIKRTSELKAD